jgi:S1-C subfamily serine protease
LPVEVIRDRKAKTLSLTTAETPPERETPSGDGDKEDRPGEESSAEWEGARLTALTPDLAGRLVVPAGMAGVVVAAVDPGGLAERLGLEQGDVILSVNRQRTPSLAAFEKVSKSVSEKEGVLLDILRRGRGLFLSYRDGQ